MRSTAVSDGPKQLWTPLCCKLSPHDPVCTSHVILHVARACAKSFLHFSVHRQRHIVRYQQSWKDCAPHLPTPRIPAKHHTARIASPASPSFATGNLTFRPKEAGKGRLRVISLRQGRRITRCLWSRGADGMLPVGYTLHGAKDFLRCGHGHGAG